MTEMKYIQVICGCGGYYGKYTDEEIRNHKKLTLKIAGDYLGISPNAVGIGMRNNLLPIGDLI